MSTFSLWKFVTTPQVELRHLDEGELGLNSWLEHHLQVARSAGEPWCTLRLLALVMPGYHLVWVNMLRINPEALPVQQQVIILTLFLVLRLLALANTDEVVPEFSRCSWLCHSHPIVENGEIATVHWDFWNNASIVLVFNLGLVSFNHLLLHALENLLWRLDCIQRQGLSSAHEPDVSVANDFERGPVFGCLRLTYPVVLHLALVNSIEPYDWPQLQHFPPVCVQVSIFLLNFEYRVWP